MRQPERTLTQADIEALVAGLADELERRGLVSAAPSAASAVERPWLTADQVAKRLGYTVDWVYAHKAELGAKPMGNGPKPRLRFDPRRVDAAELQTTAAIETRSTTCRPRKTPLVTQSGAPLLPIRDTQ